MILLGIKRITRLYGVMYLMLIFLFALVCMSASDSSAAPITFNTALPVAKGEGILRVQTMYLRSTDDQSAQDRELTVWTFPAVGAYGITGDLAVFGIVPVLDKSLETNTPLGRRTRGDTGIGDATLIIRYTLWKEDRLGQTIRIAPFIGIEVPTGEDDKKDAVGRLPQDLQLGSGSWDPLAGMIITWQTLNRQIDAAVSYKLNTKANDFRFGDEARFDISYQHRIRPQELGAGVPAFIYGVLESNLIWQDKNKIGGVRDKDSGGITWFLTPGIQYVTKRIVAEAAVQVPVIQELNGKALKNDFIGIVSLRVNF